MDEVLEWFGTKDARFAARRELERLRLPMDLADDVVQDARIRVMQTLARGGVVPDNPIAYAYRALQNAARDLYRRSRRRLSAEAFDDLPAAAEEGAADVDVSGLLEDDCRRAVHGSLALRLWVGAAALNELTFRLHQDVPFPDGAPTPENWAALWLVGRTDCFPDEDHPEDAAMRQRRARALAAVRDELRRAVEVALAGER
jgi:RNA polymerase sigma factor (sigma-70 family)